MTVLLGGFAATQMLYVAARLRLAEHLAHGPQTVAALAQQSGAREEPLTRMVRALAAFGVFSVNDGKVANTPLSDCLRAEAPESVRDLALLYGEEHYHAMAELLEAVRRGGSAFEHAYRKPHFSYLASNPDAAQAYYGIADAGLARTAASLAAEYDFSRATRVVDVGGGQLARAVLVAHPRLTAVIVDTAGKAAKARSRILRDGLDDRCEVETADILSVVPHGDLYLLGHVLHGLDDEHASCVLRACERSAATGARFLVIERLIPDVDAPSADAQFAAVSDVVALAVSGGRERSVEEVDLLLEHEGLERKRLIRLSSGDTVVEAVRSR